MSLLSPEEAQALGAGGGLTTAELQDVIDREEAELIRRFGAHYVADTPISETIEGGGISLYLKRPIGSISSIAEYYALGDVPTTLAATDYYVWSGEGRITRLPESYVWGRVVVVGYVPQDDSDLRKMVLIELVRIASEQSTSGGAVSGLSFSQSGGSDTDGSGWASQRAAQYARLGWLTR